MGDDLGTKYGQLISPEIYKLMIKPRHEKVYQYVKNNSDFSYSSTVVDQFMILFQI